MNNLINIQNQDGKLVVTSRQIAEHFEKEHAKVIRAIEGKVLTNPKLASLGIMESSYLDAKGENRKEYLLTRDGFTFIVMGFTGSNADEWKLKYIEAFNKMEQQLNKPMSIEDLIIMQAQALKDTKEQLNQVNHHALEAKAQAEEANQKVESIRDTMTLDHDSWRKECNNLINRISKQRGGTKEAYSEVRDEAYKLTEQRAGANLKQRVINKQDRLRREGLGKSKVDAVSKIDAIADDKKLKEIYIAVVKEMAIKYGVA